MAATECRHFTGYKPCGLGPHCDEGCRFYSPTRERILIVSLEALGAVLRSTAILPALHRKYPGAHITWITKSPAHQLLQGNPLVDRVLTTSTEHLFSLAALEFEIAMVLDKSVLATAIAHQAKAKRIFGFKSGHHGEITPANPEARELWELGLSNQKKFFENQKPETQLMVEALALGPYRRDPYIIAMTEEEEGIARLRRKQWSPKGEKIVGINTGSSPTIPYKKLTVEFQAQLAELIHDRLGLKVVLLGGPEDTVRNQQIAAKSGAILSPTENGLRDGLCSVAACDLILTGDSLGMHMAIGLKKWVVAWFGPTCAQEIDLYDRGMKILTRANCSPCWKRQCFKSVMCYDQVSAEEILTALAAGLTSTVDRLSTTPYRAFYEGKSCHPDGISG